jgi:tRNA(fMet)-specific endonuclease VapC
MFILDTDHLTIIQRRTEPAYSNLNFRLSRVSAEGIYTTIVSFEEQTRGWLALISRFKNVQQQIAAYQKLHRLLSFFSEIPVLDFDQAAAEQFARLRRAKLRIGSMDLKIASIALAQKATLLSCNLTDFRQVPELQVEDWST